MSVFTAEIKKQACSRMTIVVSLTALLLAVLLAFLPTTFASSSYTDEHGNAIELRGLSSIRYEKEQQKAIAGEVTPEKVRKAVEDYQECLSEYGVENSYELPDGIYSDRITPYAPLLSGVKEAFADSDT